MPVRDQHVHHKMVEVREYEGESSIDLAATQLGSGFSETRKRQIVDEWVAFFGSGPTPIRSLRFRTRTPKRLFAALSSQSQLTALQVKWGDYEDLRVLSEMTGLVSLRLRGARVSRTSAHSPDFWRSRHSRLRASAGCWMRAPSARCARSPSWNSEGTG